MNKEELRRRSSRGRCTVRGRHLRCTVRSRAIRGRRLRCTVRSRRLRRST